MKRVFLLKEGGKMTKTKKRVYKKLKKRKSYPITKTKTRFKAGGRRTRGRTGGSR